MIYLWSQYPNAVAYEVRDSLLSNLEYCLRGIIYRSEVARAKQTLISEILAERKTSLGLAHELGFYAILTGDPLRAFEYVDQVRRVGRRELVAVASHYIQIGEHLEFQLAPKSVIQTANGTDYSYLETWDVIHEFPPMVVADMGYVANQAAGNVHANVRRLQDLGGGWNPVWPREQPGNGPAETLIQLDNGLRLLLMEDATATFVEIHTIVGTGIAVETAEQAGISDFTNRMLLENATNLYGEPQFVELELLGAFMSTTPRMDFSSLTLNVPSYNLYSALPLYLKTILEPEFFEEDLVELKNTILLEIEDRDEEPFAVAEHQLRSFLYGDGGYGNPLTGTKNSVQSFSLSDISQFYDRYYAAENMLIVAAGNLVPEQMAARLSRAFEDLNAPSVEYNRVTPKAVLNSPERMTVKRDGIGLALVTFGFPGPSLQSRDYAAMPILDLVLGGGSSSRLFSIFREQEGDSYSVGSFLTPLMGDSYLTIYGYVLPEDRSKFIEITLSEIQDIAENGISEQELEKSIQQAIGARLMFHEWVGTKAFWMGADELSGLGHGAERQIAESIKGVTVDDVQRVAEEYLYSYAIAEVIPSTQS